MSEQTNPVARHYDELADYWDRFTQGPWKRMVLWPSVRSMVPDIDDGRVLDVGCGDGHYTAWLADQNMDAVGIDMSEEMIRNARQTYGDSAEFKQADVTESLVFVDDGEFDMVLCQHVFSHLPNIDPVLAEFARILCSGGTLVLSTHHPFHDFRVVERESYPETADMEGVTADPVVKTSSEDPDYHNTEQFQIHWGGPDSGNPGLYYRRSLSDLVQPLIPAGFDLRELREPSPTAEFEQEHPNHAEIVRSRPPRAICLRAEHN